MAIIYQKVGGAVLGYFRARPVKISYHSQGKVLRDTVTAPENNPRGEWHTVLSMSK